MLMPPREVTTLLVLLSIWCTLVSCHSHHSREEDDDDDDETTLQFANPSKNKNQEVFDDSVIHDQEHIREHFQGIANMDVYSMSKNQREFHFFQLHDFDKNSKLDGWEIMMTLQHSKAFKLNMNVIDKLAVREGLTVAEIKEKKRQVQENYMIRIEEVIDSALENYDNDNDGYLSYPEYKQALGLQANLRGVDYKTLRDKNKATSES